jgi:hypothetical protein
MNRKNVCFGDNEQFLMAKLAQRGLVIPRQRQKDADGQVARFAYPR